MGKTVKSAGFAIEQLPTEYGIMDLGLPHAAEIITAEVLQARVAPSSNPGFDVYQSELFPGLTFQVKLAQAREQEGAVRIIKGRTCVLNASPTWAWSEAHALGADWYVLFGVKDGTVYPFAVPVFIWHEESYDTGTGGRFLSISCDQYSKCGRHVRSYKRNKFWQYRIPKWPDGLLARVAFYSKHGNVVQLQLSA